MNCSSEPGVIAAGAGALPGARRRCEAGTRTYGRATRTCLALLAATALLAMAAPAQAQTEIWSATLTPQVISSSGSGTLGCKNSNPAAQQCSNTAVLSDDDFTLGSTDHTIGLIGLTGGSNLSFLSNNFLTAPDTLVLEVGTTSFAFSDGFILLLGTGRIWTSTGLSWTAGTDVSVRLISLTAPGAPTGLAATATGPSRIDLAWTAPASTGGSAITGYKIEVSPDGSSWSDLVADTASTATTYAHMGLNAATTRHYRVSAINAVGTSDPSGTDDATTEANTVTAQTVFISNTGQPDGSVTTLSSNYFAQQFQTGSNVGGYTLSEIVVSLATASSAFTPAFAIHRTTTDSSSREVPGTEVVGLVGSVAATGLQGFTPDSATTLSASTKYFVVFKGTSSGAILQQASTGTVDPGFATGWEIPVGILNSRDSGSTWSVRISSQSYKIQIKGTAVGTASTNTAPTVANAIQDQTATVGTALSYAFPANTFADTDAGDTLTYTATKSDDSALPSWLSFAAATRMFSGTPTAADVGTVSVKVTASDGNGGSVSDTFDIVVSAAPNTLATGAPTITGTAQVGQTLTAVTTGITDSDGLTSPTYTYQWIRVDGTDEEDISGENSSTYTLVDADLGKTIKVKVSFTDDASNAETLTSAATVTVAADTTPPEVESVTVSITGGDIFLNFDEGLDVNAGEALPYSAFSVTADGQALPANSLTIQGTELTVAVQNRAIKQGQTVVVSYTDPTTGDDTVALQDSAGNDVASFTTGMSGVPAVTNDSTVATTNTAPTAADQDGDDGRGQGVRLHGGRLRLRR